MLLECGCGKMYRVRDGATNPPKNCPACGGPLRASGGAPAAAPAPAAPAAPPSADPRVKELESRIQGLEREQGASRAAVELKEKELHEAQSSIARLGVDLEKAQGAYKEALLKKDAELAERAAQATKLILSKDEALREAREKIESLETKAGDSSMEQELNDSRVGKAQLVEELSKVEDTYKEALENKEKEVDTLQKKVQDLEKQLTAATPKASTPEGQRFQARIASLERIVQDGESRYRMLQKELDAVQGGGAADASKRAVAAEKNVEERDAKIRELEAQLKDARNEVKDARDEADQARAQSAGAAAPGPDAQTSTRLGEVRYLSSDLDRGLASISTALNGLVSRVRRLNETLQDIPEAVPAGKSSGSHRAVPPAAAAEESEGVPLVDAPPAEPDAPPDLPPAEVEEPTPIDGVPQLESFPAPEEVPSSLPADETLLDMGGVQRPPKPEDAPAEEGEPAPAEEGEPEAVEGEEAPAGKRSRPLRAQPPQKKGFFGKLFGKKKP